MTGGSPPENARNNIAGFQRYWYRVVIYQYFMTKQYPEFKLTVEGYCDERGSDEYNLALGDARAQQTKEYLATLGLPGNQLATISYGKDKPVCTDHDEACWQKNRRTHITQAVASN